jgi:hypothetical protein
MVGVGVGVENIDNKSSVLAVEVGFWFVVIVVGDGVSKSNTSARG